MTDTEHDPAAADVVLPGAIAVIDADDGDAFQRTDVDVADAIAAGAGDMMAATLSPAEMKSSSAMAVRVMSACVVDHRCIVERRHRDAGGIR